MRSTRAPGAELYGAALWRFQNVQRKRREQGQVSLLLEQETEPLDSWKEIAAYLNRNVRTVQRWEKREGLPIHRHVHEKASSVSACKKEIDAWQKQRSRASDEITEYQKELELVIERLKTKLLVKHMREALAIALHNDSL
jgi:hypothetical protein